MTTTQRNILIIAGIFILIGALFTAVYIGGKIPMNDAGTTGNTAGNLNNGGLFCESDGKVYFANAYDGGALYCMNPNETEINSARFWQWNHWQYSAYRVHGPSAYR